MGFLDGSIVEIQTLGLPTLLVLAKRKRLNNKMDYTCLCREGPLLDHHKLNKYLHQLKGSSAR